MLTVHHLGVSQSERIIWLCEELGLTYELVRHARDPVTKLAPPGYKNLHPLGTAPIITDGALVLPESGAIIEYIIHKYGAGRLALPPAHPDYASYLFWFHFANGSVMPNEMIGMVVNLLGGGDHRVLKALLGRAEAAYALIEARLAAVPYLAGQEFTAADIIMFFPLTTLRAFAPRDLSVTPHTQAYVRRLGERPAYKTAMQKGDPGMAPMLG